METKTNHHDLISLTSLWHRWWHVFSTHFLFWIFLSFVPWFLTYVVSVLMLGKFILALNSADSWNQIIGWQSSTLYFTLIGSVLIIVLQIFGALILTVGVVNYRELNTKSVLARTFKLFWSYVGLVVLLGLISLIVLVISYLVVISLSALVGLLNFNSLDNWFAWFNILPALASLIASAYLIFAPYSLVEKGHSPLAAIKHSFFLVHGHFWPTVIRLVIAYLVILTIVLLLYLVPWVGPLTALTISGPALAIYIYLLYNDLASIKKK